MKKALITDLDNTLFDWVDIWYNSFSAMLKKVIEISGVQEDVLKSEIRTIHQKHGTSEYAFLLEELPCLQRLGSGEDIRTIFKPAIEQFREARSKSLKLYPTVSETLSFLASKGVTIVAYTESMAFYTNYRLRKLALDETIDILFSPEDHDLPKGMDVHTIRKYPAESYQLKKTIHKYTPTGQFKPNVDILNAILSEIGLRTEDCVYVGDSRHKDIAMAEDVGVDHAWAKYGIALQRPEYELLREVTHWSDEDVEREKRVAARDVEPEIVLDKHFGQILEKFDFVGNK
ncbi:HAD family hydrolase [Ruegeria sp. HKCCA0235A]|uniref:HAD family hydrolase n=1 Tax=Ruegeria sp. HKCCA0235A TaxID=2682998 RepID=UPI00148803DF|nr:HAD family hydrolase [Ruegeria sp. HKCCA0235A]